MNLTLLHQAPELTVYHDSWNNWLFLDWHGELTLSGVQAASLALVRCCPYPYQRVLNSNANVTHVPVAVTAWLGLELLPLLEQVGVEHLAWVRASCPSGRQLVARAQGWLTSLELEVFDELEPAVAWLQHTQPPGPPALRQVLAQARVQANAPHTQRFAARVSEQLAGVGNN